MRLILRHTIRRFLLVLPALLCACADGPLNTPPLALRDEALPYIGNTRLYTVVTQTQLQASTSSGAGLSLNKARLLSLLYGPLATPPPAAEPVPGADDGSGLQPLRDALSGYNFDQSLQASLQEQLQPVAWLKLQDAVVLKQPGGTDALPRASAGTTLWVVTRYELSADFSTLSITAQCALTPPLRPGSTSSSTSSNGIEQQFDDAAYRNQLSYAVRLATPSASRDGNARQWQAQDGAGLRAALTRGIALLSQALALDLQHQIPRSSANKQLADGEYAPLVRSDGSAVLFRFEDGALKYFDSLDPASVSATSLLQQRRSAARASS